MVNSIERNMSAAKLRAATGRGHRQWRALLTEAGATSWGHGAIAKYLVDAHGVDPWWAQGITVDFEQAVKGRLPGQRPDGTFTVSRTATVSGERLEALARVAASVTARYGEPYGENLAAGQPVVRWRLTDGTRLAAVAQAPNKSGTPINLTWEKLPDAGMLPARLEVIDGLFLQAR